MNLPFRCTTSEAVMPKLNQIIANHAATQSQSK